MNPFYVFQTFFREIDGSQIIIEHAQSDEARLPLTGVGGTGAGSRGGNWGSFWCGPRQVCIPTVSFCPK